MDRAHLAWEPIHLTDPEGGSYILWPHLPCIESPEVLRPSGDWSAIAILASSEDIWRWEQEFSEDQKNQINIQKAFDHRAKMNGLSSTGKWSENLEKEVA